MKGSTKKKASLYWGHICDPDKPPPPKAEGDFVCIAHLVTPSFAKYLLSKTGHTFPINHWLIVNFVDDQVKAKGPFHTLRQALDYGEEKFGVGAWYRKIDKTEEEGENLADS